MAFHGQTPEEYYIQDPSPADLRARKGEQPPDRKLEGSPEEDFPDKSVGGRAFDRVLRGVSAANAKEPTQQQKPVDD